MNSCIARGEAQFVIMNCQIQSQFTVIAIDTKYEIEMTLKFHTPKFRSLISCEI